MLCGLITAFTVRSVPGNVSVSTVKSTTFVTPVVTIVPTISFGSVCNSGSSCNLSLICVTPFVIPPYGSKYFAQSNASPVESSLTPAWVNNCICGGEPATTLIEVSSGVIICLFK